VVGKTLAVEDDTSRGVRIYLAGGIAVRGPNGATVGERAFAGRQGRRLFVRLAALHEPVSTADLADDLWGPEWPARWKVALRALVSKLRTTLTRVDAAAAVDSADGTYALRLPAGAWLDVDAAAEAVHRAETELATGDAAAAAASALIARSIASRSLLPGEEGEWLDILRARLADVRLRALECLGAAWIARGDAALAARDAAEAIRMDPFRESAHRLLIRAHLAAGDRAAAARAYEACRTLLRDELGVEPSEETVALATAALRGG
jgi:SARP family transcriptional regulator, regulator of embCAB operon